MGLETLPDSPEALATRFRAATAHFASDPYLAARVLARARTAKAIEAPAVVVLAIAASLVLWLSVQSEGAHALDGDTETSLSFDAEASL